MPRDKIDPKFKKQLDSFIFYRKDHYASCYLKRLRKIVLADRIPPGENEINWSHRLDVIYEQNYPVDCEKVPLQTSA